MSSLLCSAWKPPCEAQSAPAKPWHSWVAFNFNRTVMMKYGEGMLDMVVIWWKGLKYAWKNSTTPTPNSPSFSSARSSWKMWHLNCSGSGAATWCPAHTITHKQADMGIIWLKNLILCGLHGQMWTSYIVISLEYHNFWSFLIDFIDFIDSSVCVQTSAICGKNKSFTNFTWFFSALECPGIHLPSFTNIYLKNGLLSYVVGKYTIHGASGKLFVF